MFIHACVYMYINVQWTSAAAWMYSVFQLPRTTRANIWHQKIRKILIGVIRLIHRSSVVEAGTDSPPEFSDSSFCNKLKKKNNNFHTLTLQLWWMISQSPVQILKKPESMWWQKYSGTMALWLVKNKDSTLTLYTGHSGTSLTAFFCGILTTFNLHF